MTDVLLQQVLGEYCERYGIVWRGVNEDSMRRFGECPNPYLFAHQEALEEARNAAFALGVDFIGYELRIRPTFPHLSNSDVSDVDDVYKADSDAEPIVAEPIVAEPVVAEPVVAESVVAEPVVAESVVAEPAITDNDYAYDYESDNLDGYEPETESVSRVNLFEGAGSDGVVRRIAIHRGRTLLYTVRTVDGNDGYEKIFRRCEYLS